MPMRSWINHWMRLPTPLGELIDAGRLVNGRGTGWQGWRHYPYYALVLLIEGEGRYRDEAGLDRRVVEGDCWWIRPGRGHQYGPERGDRWSEIYLSVAGPAFASWTEDRLLGREPIRRLPCWPDWQPRWEGLAQARPKDRRQVLETLAQIHLLLGDVAAAESGPPPLSDLLETSRLRLEAWPSEVAVDWRQLAAECGCGYEKWRKVFRTQVGLSPARYRRKALMERAARLLERLNLSNSELAERFGCGDAFHFSKLFKSVHGASPRSYRSARKQRRG